MPSYADEKDVARAKAALALAKAKRERVEAKATATEMECHKDYAAAVEEAKRLELPLVLWVGVKCKQHPELRKALTNAVHCHQESTPRYKEPAIVVQGSDGNEYFIRPENVTAETPAKIREKWSLPYVPPLRPDVRIAEEFVYVYPPQAPIWTAPQAQTITTPAQGWSPIPLAFQPPRTATYAAGGMVGGAVCTT